MTDDDRRITGENRQGGVGLGDDQHRLTPDIARGDRAGEAVVSPTDEDPIGRVQFSQPVDGPVAPQMIDDHGDARPESGLGDVAQVPAGASIWEAVEADDRPAVRSGQPMPAAEALDRAREPGYAPEPLGKTDIDHSREDDGL